MATGQPLFAEKHIIGEVLVEGGTASWSHCFVPVGNGDSMIKADTYEGDLVIVRQQPVAESGDIVAALFGEEATVWFQRGSADSRKGGRCQTATNEEKTMMTTSPNSDFGIKDLQDAVKIAAAIRCRTRLQPAGGAGDKVFPPTYSGGVYATEKRRLDGQEVDVVVLDSVQSQANRMEQALLDAYRRKKIALPMLSVSFAGIDKLEDIGEITVLDAPHRLADAIFRDSYQEIAGTKTLFPDTPQGEVLRRASLGNATELFKICPTALIFGVWDSTGSVSAEVAAKFPRTLVSEIIGVGFVVGVKTASKIDPLQIGSVPIYERRKDAPGECEWTANEEDAEKDAKGKPIRYAKKDASKSKGKPSEINHGNVTPDIVHDDDNGNPIAGGVTIDYALHTVVLSLAGLRKLRFPAPECSDDYDHKARTVLAALGLAAITAQQETGYDLRSRCLLVPEARSHFEIVAADGSTRPFVLDADGAYSLLSQACDELPDALRWNTEKIELFPTDSLVALVRMSREGENTIEEATGAENA